MDKVVSYIILRRFHSNRLTELRKLSTVASSYLRRKSELMITSLWRGGEPGRGGGGGG